MKKFKLQTGQTITVDDCHAYLLRSYVWNGSEKAGRGGLTVKRASAGHSQVLLSHEILGIPEGLERYVVHNNGDLTDFRQANLVALDRDGWKAHMSTTMKARRAENALLGLRDKNGRPK
jgi:hypothetical protein